LDLLQEIPDFFETGDAFCIVESVVFFMNGEYGLSDTMVSEDGRVSTINKLVLYVTSCQTRIDS